LKCIRSTTLYFASIVLLNDNDSWQFVIVYSSGYYSQFVDAQQVSGAITAAEGGEPFGGEQKETVSVDSTGRRTNISTDLND
jgi:hypothetical protein